MRNLTKTLALAAALTAAPAMAQINVGLGGQAGANVGVGGAINPGSTIGSTVGGATGTIDRTVNRTDRLVNRTVDGAMGRELSLATAADLTAGAIVRDGSGRKLGTVQSVHGDTALIVKGDKSLHVPVAELYRGTRGLVTKLTDRQLKAAAAASANAGADASVSN